MALTFLIFGKIEREDAGKNEYIVLTRSNIDTISICQAEPAFRHRCYYLTETSDSKLVLEDRSFDFQIVWPWNIHREAINEGTDQVFTDLCKFLSTTSDLIGGAQSEQTSIHASNFVAISIANG